MLLKVAKDERAIVSRLMALIVILYGVPVVAGFLPAAKWFLVATQALVAAVLAMIIWRKNPEVYRVIDALVLISFVVGIYAIFGGMTLLSAVVGGAVVFGLYLASEWLIRKYLLG